MKKILSYSFTATAAILLSTVCTAPYALQVTAGEKTNDVIYNDLLTRSNMRIEHLRQQLERERQERVAGDIHVQQTIATQLAAIDARLVTLNGRVTKLSADVALAQTEFLKEVAQLQKDATALRKEMNRQMSLLNTEVTNLRNHKDATVNQLQSRINTINANITELNGTLSYLRTRMTNQENFATYLHNRLEQLRACFANGSCVAYSPPRVETRDFEVAVGNSGFEQRTTYFDTKLPTSTWQYCSLAGATNQSRRDFRIYESGGTWWVSNEWDNHAPGDETGALTARCMRVY